MKGNRGILHHSLLSGPPEIITRRREAAIGIATQTRPGTTRQIGSTCNNTKKPSGAGEIIRLGSEGNHGIETIGPPVVAISKPTRKVAGVQASEVRKHCGIIALTVGTASLQVSPHYDTLPIILSDYITSRD